MTDYRPVNKDKEILTPSDHGEKCRHNGENPEFEIACDNCDYYLLCFPETERIFADRYYDVDSGQNLKSAD